MPVESKWQDADQDKSDYSRKVKLPFLLLLTAAALVSFAANSILCRLALQDARIDAATFTFIRLASGAGAIWLITVCRSLRRVEERHPGLTNGNWLSAFALFSYAAAFSFAYINLPAGTGALLLFGAVQVSMIFWGFYQGERLCLSQKVGFFFACIGLVILLARGLSAPPLSSSALMLFSGACWGIYSLRGKSSRDAIATTAGNFICAVPFSVILICLFRGQLHADQTGLFYAAASGTITSGVGYVIWYTVLPRLRSTTAAAVQLSVPVFAAIGGILLLGESMTIRMAAASTTILAGIALVIFGKQAPTD